MQVLPAYISMEIVNKPLNDMNKLLELTPVIDKGVTAVFGR
jgi:hypothetical protein